MDSVSDNMDVNDLDGVRKLSNNYVAIKLQYFDGPALQMQINHSASLIHKQKNNHNFLLLD